VSGRSLEVLLYCPRESGSGYSVKLFLHCRRCLPGSAHEGTLRR